MIKEKISNIEISILLFFLLNSYTSTIIINLFDNYNSLEIIISLLLSFICGYLFISLYIKYFNNDYLNNISSNNIVKNFKKIVFFISISLFLIYSVINTSNMIKDILLSNTDIRIIRFIFLIICFILGKKCTKSVITASNIFFILFIIIEIISILFNIENINPINILPLNTNITYINFFDILILTISPVFMSLIIPKGLLEDYKKVKKSIKKTYIIFYIYLTLKILLIISILGTKYYSILKYPEITCLKYINIFNFFNRLEEFLFINIYINNLIISALSINYLLNIVSSFKTKKNNNSITFIILSLVIINLNTLTTTYLVSSGIIFIIVNLFKLKKEQN